MHSPSASSSCTRKDTHTPHTHPDTQHVSPPAQLKQTQSTALHTRHGGTFAQPEVAIAARTGALFKSAWVLWAVCFGAELPIDTTTAKNQSIKVDSAWRAQAALMSAPAGVHILDPRSPRTLAPFLFVGVLDQAFGLTLSIWMLYNTPNEQLWAIIGCVLFLCVVCSLHVWFGGNPRVCCSSRSLNPWLPALPLVAAAPSSAASSPFTPSSKRRA